MTARHKELSWRKNDSGTKELSSFEEQTKKYNLQASKKKEEITLLKGVGPMKRKYLSQAGINTIKDIVNAPTNILRYW